MNEIHSMQIVIDFDVWSAKKKEAFNDVDDLIHLIKEHKIMKHCGNVVSRLSEKGTTKV